MSKHDDRYEAIERLSEIQAELRDLIDEALDIVRAQDRDEFERARSYWYAHVTTAITDDHNYLGSSMCSMQDTIAALEESAMECERCGERCEQPHFAICEDCAEQEVRP